MKLDELIRNVAEHVSDAILITDAASVEEPKVVYVNSSFSRMTGYAPEDILGKTPRILQGPDTDSAARAQIRRALEAGEGVTVDILNYRKDGAPHWVELAIRPVSDDAVAAARPAFFVSVQRDVSGRKAAEQKMEAARHAASRADAAKSHFLSHMSHELRTPLNAILGFAEMINQQILGPVGHPKYLEYSADILLSGEFLLSLISDILDFAKIEAGRVELNEEEFDLAELIDDVRHITRGLGARLDVVLDFEGAEGFHIRADRRLLQQVFINLISNAMRFTERGGRVIFSVLRLADGRLACIVTDNGPGIPAAKTLDVLQPYVSLKNGKGTAQSTGLGLPISKSFVEFHGGSLFINSELGAGTSVYVTLPAERVLAAPEALGAGVGAAIQAMETMATEQIDHLTDTELDRLPIGVLLLAADGTILRYNATESRFSGLLPEEVIGRNFFTEVAPCTGVSELRQVFQGGLSGDENGDAAQGGLNAVLFHTFRFPNREMRVLVQMRAAKEPRQGWMFVRWL